MLTSPSLEVRDRMISRLMASIHASFTTGATYGKAVLESLKAGVCPPKQIPELRGLARWTPLG